MSINTVTSFSPTSIIVGLLLEALAAGDIYDQVTLPGLPNAIHVPERDAVIAATTVPAPLFGGELEAIATEHRLDVILLRIGDLEDGRPCIAVDFALGSLPCAVWVERRFSLYQDADGTWLVPAGFGPAVSVTWQGFNLEIVPPYADLIERADGIARAARSLARFFQPLEA
ncbi:hypothetical protein QLH51_10970 [Sphingomonas sp. 2R-10]|uniref:hypothetical protein n=1 Tax=Sphingomonas sp. 2R-10 TaxID=3045148 RepID=UPI000F7B36CA|nr:hypothetical protein [Sphingomonas sp. 2R-10]MDJ0277315.1 hypothetical protein [Sphingomonas sp. 2R-10]